MALLIDMGWGDWRLADPGLAPTRVTQAQADKLAGMDAVDAGAADVRFGDQVGDLLVNAADGKWWLIGPDGSTDDVTTEVMG